MTFYPRGISRYIRSFDQHNAFRGFYHTTYNIHDSRLSGTVGTQQTVYPLLSNLKINIPHRPLDIITMRQMFHFYYSIFQHT